VSLPYLPDSGAYFAALRDLPDPVWLDSGSDATALGQRYDIISADPFVTIERSAGVTSIRYADGRVGQTAGDALDAVRELLGPKTASQVGVPFCGGAIGYLAYDYEASPRRSRAPGSEWPALAVGIYDWAVIVDHEERRSWLVQQGRDPRQPSQRADPLSRLQRLVAVSAPAPIAGSLVENGMTRAEYARGFQRIQQYIREGDCYQVNYAQRFVVETPLDAWSLYRHMRQRNPAPHGALLEYGFGQVLSASPEQFLRVRDRVVETRPIKGTRPRGADPVEDATLRADLHNSAKDRAENLMIVDLLRNDLGQVCRPGSIAVPRLFEIESFATVHHLVSTVVGELAADRDAIDLLRACFPGGSITGAPKLRAMQIIDELEPCGREVYCGSVFRLGFDGNLDSSIAIRTALLRNGRLSYWAGGGIVADSVCEAEYRESLDKAAAFLALFSEGG
jgi:para-aminobenzoate synthetase component 1